MPFPVPFQTFSRVACTLLVCLGLQSCGLQPQRPRTEYIPPGEYAEHSCPGLREALADMRRREQVLADEVRQLRDPGAITTGARPPKDRGHSQALAEVRAHQSAIRAQASRSNCALPASAAAG